MGQHRASRVVLAALLLAAATREGAAGSDRTARFCVLDHGAVPDGSTKNTHSIQKAVDTAHAGGGGIVLFPPGRYLTGAFAIKSRVTLELAPGATLLGSTDPADYPPPSRKACFALIQAADAVDIAITGSGAIDGQGGHDVWKITPPHYHDPPRPSIIHFRRCRQVRIETIRLRNAPAWVQHYEECDDLVIDGISVESHCNYNNDMLDVDGCKNVRIINCTGNTGDDALTFKSTTGRLCENITVSNCVVSSHANALKFGTESRGGFRNVTVSNLVVRPARAEAFHLGDRRGLGGIALEMVDGGVLERITISNVAMERTTAPIFMRLGDCRRQHRSATPPEGVGTFRDVVISNVIASGVSSTGCAIAGLPGHCIENVTLSRIRIRFAGGGTMDQVHREVPERPDCYPECTMFGELPAYGFYARHVRGLTLDDIDVRWEEADVRPALVCDDVRDLNVNRLRADGASGGASTIMLRDTRHALIRGCRSPESVPAFVEMDGSTFAVSIIGNDLSTVAHPFLPVDAGMDRVFHGANRLRE